MYGISCVIHSLKLTSAVATADLEYITIAVYIAVLSLCEVITGPPTHSIGGQ